MFVFKLSPVFSLDTAFLQEISNLASLAESHESPFCAGDRVVLEGCNSQSILWHSEQDIKIGMNLFFGRSISVFVFFF